jgi:PhzF family phenazine biosynthesis protein
MKIQAQVVSAFTKDGKGGNKAGVVLFEPELTAMQKTAIAAELGFSETAFVSASDRADYRLEYFTPAGEIPLCGHATIGTFSLLASQHRIAPGSCTIETKAGLLSIETDAEGGVFMEQNRPAYFEEVPPEDITPCFSAAAPLLNPALPAQIVSTGLRDIMLPVADVAVLGAMTPDFPASARLSEKRDCVGIHAFALSDDPEITAVCRNFAPRYDIDEEAATGTSNCALASYLYARGMVRDAYVFEQGYNLHSASRIVVRLACLDGAVDRVFVGGSGVRLATRELTV